MWIARNRRGGWVLAEGVITLAVLGFLAVGLTLAMATFRQFNRVQWTRRRCVDAAQANLDSLAATGREIPKAEVQRLWPDVRITVEQTDGQGPWAGLSRVKVTAAGVGRDRRVKVHLARYMDRKGRR